MEKWSGRNGGKREPKETREERLPLEEGDGKEEERHHLHRTNEVVGAPAEGVSTCL